MLKKKKEPTPATSPKINPLKMFKEKSLSSRLVEELEDKGVIFFTPAEIGGTLNIDKDYLTLPADLTGETSKELGKYLNALTQHRMYIRSLIGWQAVDVEEMKREYYLVCNPLYATLTKKEFPSETSKERFLNSHPDVKDFFFNYRDSLRKLDLLQLNIASLDDCIFLVSREISRRTGDFNTENRNINVQEH